MKFKYLECRIELARNSTGFPTSEREFRLELNSLLHFLNPSMLKTRHVIFIFLPALIVAGFVLFIRIIQFSPANPASQTTNNNTTISVPIYPEDPILGDKNASKKIIIFGDYGCSHCQTEFELLNLILEKHKDVAFVWKGLSVTTFPISTALTHEYAYCANQQNKFLEFANFAFQNNTNLIEDTLKQISEVVSLDNEKLTACLASDKPKNYLKTINQLALSLNFDAIPAIFINNKKINNPQLLEEWEDLLK